MKFRDISIGVKLRLGFGILMLFLTILGLVAYNQGQALWSQTYNLYEHPLKVRRALGTIKSDILIIHSNMKDLASSENETEFNEIVSQIKSNEVQISQNLEILHSQYLGPIQDVQTLHKNFVRWSVARDNIIRLLRSGSKETGIRETGYGSTEDKLIEQLLQNEEKISTFAMNKSEEFYRNAQTQKSQLISAMLIILLSALGFSLLISYYLSRIIQSPLDELVEVSNKFKEGNYSARSTYLAKNEIGLLANSYNSMASALQSELSLYQKTAAVSNIMLREEEIFSFSRRLLESLMTLTESQTGAVFLLNSDRTRFEHFNSIGLRSETMKSFDAKAPEGEIGMLLASCEIQHLKSIPADTIFNYITVSGEMKPREIISIPVMRAKEVMAVISLSSIYEYRSDSLRLIRDILPTMASRLIGVLFYYEINKLAKKLEQQNIELQMQKNEMEAQAGELAEQNVELEMQKKELDEANRLKSAFLSNMSHELRTPLNSIIALSGVLSRRLTEKIPETEYGYLDVISRNGSQLLTLINDILDISRIEAGKVEFDYSIFQPQELINELVSMIEPQATEKQVRLYNDTRDEIPLVVSDYGKCRHIVQNLIGNAVKFTREGEVIIRAELTGGKLRISVSDTGIGIAPDKLSHIFDEFRQADESTSRQFGGSGLGLAIARKYAMMLNGNIEVESTLGQGSVFTLWLPVGDKDNTAYTAYEHGDAGKAQPSMDTESAFQQTKKRTILIVEDSEPAIIQLQDILLEQGYQTIVARNGREALEMISVVQPDGIILDLMMPEVDGFQVLRELRSNEVSAIIPVLILTAKHITKAEMSFLKGNHIYQLIQKGDINKANLLREILNMLSPPPPKPDPAAVTRRVSHDNTPRILIVEDNEDNMLTIRALLEDKYEILEASDGKQGVEKTRQYKPDLILMDIALPIMNGLQAMEVIRRDENLKHIPIVAVTASVMKGNREEILACGFDGFIAKPINHQQFHDVLEGFLNGPK